MCDCLKLVSNSKQGILKNTLTNNFTCFIDLHNLGEELHREKARKFKG